MLWVRVEQRISYEWVLLYDDPSLRLHLYELDVQQDESTTADLWNLGLYMDGEFKTELSGLKLPKELSVKIRNWNYENYMPPITDPFNPFHTTSIISQVLVPLPQVRHRM